MEVRIDTHELVKELKELEKRGRNLGDVNLQLAQIMHNMVEDKFEQQGPGWPALSPVTIMLRRSSTSPKMLQDTGMLVGSLQPYGGRNFAEVFTNKPYAKFHIEGDGVPKRDFFDIDTDKALKIFGEIITEEIGRGR